MYHKNHYHHPNMFACQGPMSKSVKWIVGIIILIFISYSTYYFLTADERAAQEAIIIDNFSTAVDDLLKNPGLDLSNLKITTAEQLIGSGIFSNHTWYITSDLKSDEYQNYYYSFRIIRIVRHSNYIDWICIPEYHLVNMKLNPDIILEPLDFKADITDENLSKWPYVGRPELLRQQDRKKFVDLLKKVQQQTAHLFETK